MRTKHALMVFHEGFEEIEAISPLDILRRAKVEVDTVSLQDKMEVVGAHGVSLRVDECLRHIEDFSKYDMLVIPGGPGVFNILNDSLLLSLIQDFHKNNKWIAAICAAPLLLKEAGVLPQKYTAHFSVIQNLPEALPDAVVVDGNVITSKGSGSACEFAFACAQALQSEELVNKLKKSMSF